MTLALLRRTSLGALFVALAAAGCGRTSGPAPDASAPLTMTPLTLPVPAGASEPNITVSSRGPLVSWVEQAAGQATLRFAERTGNGWSEPRSVVSGTDWFLSAADVPTVMRMADGTLVAAWYRTTKIEFEAYDTWLAWSKDEGRTWSAPFRPYSDRTITQHGFASLFDQPGGGLGLVWLDAREWELNQDAPDGGSVMLRHAAFDTAWKQTADALINLRVCDCCQTAVATTPDGVVAAFRDRTQDEIRDIAVTRLESGRWTDATTVHDDKWELDSCPVNGPAIAAQARTLGTAWFTAVGGTGHSYVAFSPDAGRTWGAPVRLDAQASTGRVDIEMIGGGEAVASWVEFADQQSRVMARRVTTAGSASAPIAVQAAGEGRVNGFPRMVRHGNDLVMVWTESAAGADETSPMVQVKGAVLRAR